MTAAALLGMIVLQQRESPNALQNVVAPAVFRFALVNRWTGNRTLAFRDRFVESANRSQRCLLVSHTPKVALQWLFGSAFHAAFVLA
jgi:hypothetical protein